MAQTAAHLVDHVIPPVPVRQWVVSVPKRLRWFLAERPEAFAPLTKIFMREVERLVREATRVAPAQDRAAGAAPRIGGVSFLHRERLGTQSSCASACLRDRRGVLAYRDGGPG